MYKHGKPYTTCQRSGFLVPYDETVVEWDGLRVWKKFADPRHPQDFVRVSRSPERLEGQIYDIDYTEDNNFNVFLTTDAGNNLATDTGEYLIAG